MISHANVWLVNGQTDQFEVPPVADAEIRTFRYEVLGIDPVRELVETAHQRPVGQALQHIIVRADRITLEAQNALLKVLEDTPETTLISLVFPHDTQLLDTIHSRVQLRHAKVDDESVTFGEFLDLPVADRLALIERRTKAKDEDWMRDIKRGLLHHLSTRPDVDLQTLEFVARRLLTRGASNKLLLEELALTLPARS
jgi:DNA polymerase III delta prime subunit